ncbi:hypothetical protein JYQ62_13925 [Nostoc sp. UHCC 0702]|nr:hypothetical protein JYQ62_13925 [Nostoc sp. UHCC 0702]
MLCQRKILLEKTLLLPVAGLGTGDWGLGTGDWGLGKIFLNTVRDFSLQTVRSDQ